MKEDFLQYLWRFQKWTDPSLRTTENEEIRVLKSGVQNFDAGPDFLNAKIKIGDTLWVGNVEIHIRSSDWYRHDHHKDPAYQNVILHVVYQHDKDVLVKDGSPPLPVLCIRDTFDYNSYRQFQKWIKSPAKLPCESQLAEVPSIIRLDQLASAAIRRAEAKSDLAFTLFKMHKGDLEQVFYTLLCRALGMKVNGLPFEHFAKACPVALLRKYIHSPLQSEALLLGQAGFLSDKVEGGHPNDLAREFEFLKKKHGLTPMPASAWKFFRLRPQAFPTIRLVQLRMIYARENHLAQKIVETDSIDDLLVLFHADIDSGYWLDHFRIGDEIQTKPKRLGDASKRGILINSVVPFLIALAAYNKDASYKTRAIEILEDLAPEENKVTRKFKSMGFSNRSAFESQGMIGQESLFCEARKCLTCKIGNYILSDYV